MQVLTHRHVARHVGFIVGIALLICSATQAAAGKLKFDIQAGPASQTLNQFVAQSGLQLLFDFEAVKGLTTKTVKGELEPREALSRMLDGTGLVYEFVNEKTVTVTLNKRANSAQLNTGPEAEVAQAAADTNRQTAAEAVPGRLSPTPAVSDKSKTQGLEEIVVTAQKREERLIDTPQSVSVLSSDDLNKLRAVQFRDFANTVPGLSFTTLGAGQTQITLRGVTTGLDVGPTVGVYVDEVPFGASSAFAQASSHALDVGVFDIDRIEVLRGPQGTLYGASTLGGLVKYVTKQPDATRLDVDLQTGISSTRDGGVNYNGSAAVNAPIVSDKAAVRLSGYYSRDAGYIDNVTLSEKNINHSAVYGGRFDLLFMPSDALTVRIDGFAQNISRRGQATADYTLAGVPLVTSLTQSRNLAETFDQQFRLVSATVAYKFGPATLTSISSYQRSESQQVDDLSRVYVPLLALFLGRSYSAVGTFDDLPTKKFTQEVRLASSQQTLPIQWVIGGFYTHETSENDVAFVLRDFAGVPALNDLGTTSDPSRYQEYAGFGDLTWIVSPAFDFSGGLRYSRNEQDYAQRGAGLFPLSAPNTSSSENVSTYLANARYHFNDHATGYLRYATGYRPGGPNFIVKDPTTGLAIGSPTFQSDRLKSYEAGLKAETADLRFGMDFAAYYIDWSNIQISVVQGGFGAISNAPGGATVRGAELALNARPIRGFKVVGAFAYQDAQLSQADANLGAAKGERLPNVPRFTAALNADYELQVALRPSVGATLRYVGDRMASFDMSSVPQYRLPEYTAVDLRAGVALERVSAQLYVHNLFDKRGQLSALETNLGTARVDLLEPRTIGIQLISKFQ